MVAAAPHQILGGDLKISDQNNWGGPEQKIKFWGGAKFKGGPKILWGVGGGAMNIVGKGYHTPFFQINPHFSKIPPLSRNPRCPHLS